MEKAVLKAERRELFGKKTRFLRREGIIPANVYGQGIESLALTLEEKNLEEVVKGGTSRIVSLDVEGEKANRSVLVKNVSRHPISSNPVHVDLYQVNMLNVMTVEIPVYLIGEAPVLEYKENFLDHQLQEIQIECLPDNLPPSIEVDVSGLTEAGQVIHVADLEPGEGITFITPGDYAIVRVSQAVKIEDEEEEEVAEVETMDQQTTSDDSEE